MSREAFSFMAGNNVEIVIKNVYIMLKYGVHKNDMISGNVIKAI